MDGVSVLIVRRSVAAFQWSKSEVTDLFRFVREPTCRQQSVEEPDWLLRAVYLSLGVIIALAPFVYVIHSLQEFLGIAESRPGPIINVPTLLYVVVLGPLLEEALYRAGLRNAVYTLLVGPLVTMALLIDSEFQLLVFAVFLTINAVLAVWNRSSFFGASQSHVEKLYAEKFRLIFWANCFYFAAPHLGNFQLSGTHIGLFWLAIAPQFVFSVVLSYLRLRNGLKSAIVSHATINSVAMTAAILASL